MRNQYMDEMVSEILSDISDRKNETSSRSNISSIPSFDDAFGELLQDNDATSNRVMRRIWEELQETHR